MRSLLKDIITNRFLLWGFIRLDLRNRYGASFLGFFWSVINPLLLIVLYTLIFGYILQINVGGNAGPKNYGLFLFSGMLPWLAISDATHRASSVILENRDLVKQVNFPKILLPFRCVVGAFLHELIALGVFLAILLLVHETPSILALGLLIAIWPLQLFFTLGIALFVSSTTVFYKDMRELVGALLTLWFFGTPIIFPMALIPESIKFLFYLNPVTWLINLYRAALLGDVVPELYGFIYFSAATLLLLMFGWKLFSKQSIDLADLL